MSVGAALADGATWDGFQREALAALGHRLYVRADDAAHPAVEPAASEGVATRSSSATPELLQALARAAGCAPDRLPAIEPAQLRGAAAKRALWPSLRRLRAAAP